MKKGCFLKLVIIITILIGSVLYIIQHKLDEIFIGPGNRFVQSAIDENWDKELLYIKDSSEKDSLKSVLKFFIKDIKSTKELSRDETNEFLKLIEESFKDSLIDKTEIQEITNLAKRINHERSEKN